MTAGLLVAAACGSSSGADDAASESTQAPGALPSQTTTGTDVTLPAGGSSSNGSATTPTGSGTAPTAKVPTPPAGTAMPFRGVNLAGAEFGTAKPGNDGTDYKFPTTSEIDYFLSKGMNTFRIGFMWERMQPSAYAALVPAYVAQLDGLVTYATSKNATVILNPHNFARYYGSTVGSSQVPNAVFADLWSKLATRYQSNPRVMFNLVNEPHTMGTEQWVGAANAAIAAIRAANATQTIIAPGNAWTGAHSWNSSSYGTPNAVAMLDIVDPIDNTLYEVHQYMDADSGGKVGTCVSTTIGSERLAPFVQWLRDNGKKGFVGELAGGDNPTCNAAVTDMLNAMMAASDVLVGWLWWAAGPWWGNNVFSIEPTSNGTLVVDKPQMALLQPFLF